MSDLEIRNLHYMSKFGFIYASLLRSQKQFQMHQLVYILSKTELIPCEIIGIEMTDSDNPEYIYKLAHESHKYNKDNYINCEHIFTSIYDAENSVLIEHERQYERIKSFFNSQRELLKHNK